MTGARVLKLSRAALPLLIIASACAPVLRDGTASAAPRSASATTICARSDNSSTVVAINGPPVGARVTGPRSGRIPNGDFNAGLDGWLLSHPGAARLEPSDRDAGERLQVLSQPGSKPRFINSPRFTVTPGAAYELKIDASVPSGSTDGGTFALVFLSDREVGRKAGTFVTPSGVSPKTPYILSGTIPPTASQAFVQVSGGQSRGPANLALYDVGYAETGSIQLTGWAIDRAAAGSTEGASTGIASVSLFLDGPPGTGTAIGTATYGDERDDIAQACGNARFRNAGWHISLDAGSFTLGQHTVYALANSVRSTTAETTATLTRVPSFADDPIGDIEFPVDRAAVPRVATIGGWAIDRNSSSGTGVDAVSIYLDGNGARDSLIGVAAAGDERAGVGLHFGDPRFGRSGWHFEWDTLDVSPGPHTLYVVFQSAATGASTTLSRHVVVGTGRDIARGKPAQASATLPSFSPANAVDGLVTTTWNAGHFAPQWIEIDLQTVAPIERIRLVTAQAPLTGFTDHRVYGRSPNRDATLLHEFAAVTVEGEVLEYSPPVPWTGIRFIRIETVQSPAWVAWREIEVDLAGTAPVGSLEGVVRSSIAPVPGAKVQLRNGSEVVQTTYTDGVGAYVFRDIPGGTYAVRAYGPSPQYARSAEIAAQAVEPGSGEIVDPLELALR